MNLQRVWGGAVAMIVMDSTGMNLPHSAQACGARLSYWRGRGYGMGTTPDRRNRCSRQGNPPLNVPTWRTWMG